MTKLTNKKIKFICKHGVDKGDWTNQQLAIQYELTERRIQQLVKEYKETGKYPKLNPSRRPKSPSPTEDEKEIIDTAWDEKRLGARLLFYEIQKRNYKIPHHKINKYLLQKGWTVPNAKKQKKRKRCRYERKHSFSLVHGDWHRTTKNHPQVIVWLDDASRFAVTGGEFSKSSLEHSIETFQQAEKEAWRYNSTIREVNTDRGTEFFSNHPNSISKFQEYLLQKGIEFIPSRRSNPQTNGKLERFWFEYDKHRWRFDCIDSFLHWYNERIHGALWLKFGETPVEAVIRKLQPESIIGLFRRWVN